jgi:hypothetical protein
LDGIAEKMIDLKKWEEGFELSYAFFKFSDPFQREKYQSSDADGPIYVIKSLMFAELFGHLASEEFVAIGFRTDPSVGDGPEKIPAHCFTLRPNVAECEADVISASGWRYERVRVVDLTDQSRVSILEDPTPLASNGKRGRTSTYPLTRRVLLMLWEKDPRYIDQSAERLRDVFNAEYLANGQPGGIRLSPLSTRSLRDHLKRFRQELEETGKN